MKSKYLFNASMASAALALVSVGALMGPDLIRFALETQKKLYELDPEAIGLCGFTVSVFLSGCFLFAANIAEREERAAQLSAKPERPPKLPKPICEGRCLEQTLICHRCYKRDSEMSHYYRKDVIPPISK